jgi:two-component system response regulator AtoC
MNRIIILDDEVNLCTSLEFLLEEKYEVVSFQEPAKALEYLKAEEADVMLLDLRIGDINGIDVLREVKTVRPDIAVIMMTAYGSIDSSVNAMKAGAFYYVTKPVDSVELDILIEKALSYKSLSNEVDRLSKQLDKQYGIRGIVGNSPAMMRVFEIIDKVKDIDSNVLVLGDSGTGKEMAAKAIHFQGTRRKGRFEAINCSAIPETLLESELFGYEKGAFSGAVRSKKGKFSLAEGGTIFLDEIGDMDMKMQSKLLRVLQEREVTPLGADSSEKVDVRVIAATNCDLEQAVSVGAFRRDLYYRLNVIKIEMPPLRNRKTDIPLLVEFFINRFNLKLEKSIEGIEPEALDSLENFEFKGNVRELENMIERAMVLTDRERLSQNDFGRNVSCGGKVNEKPTYFSGEDLKTVERKMIMEALEYYGGRKRKAAEALGITERTLRNKLKTYSLSD